jgi:hypothetical protein
MVQKDILVVYNTFGVPKVKTQYIDNLNSIFWHIDKNNLHDRVRVVVSSVLNDDEYINEIKNIFKDRISIFKYDYRWAVQVSFNKTITSSIETFNEEYNGYLYVSSGVNMGQIDDLFLRLIEKNNTNEYGMIHLDVNHDHGHEHMFDDPSKQQFLDLSKDYIIPVPRFCHFTISLINKSVRDFFGRAMSDVHGVCGYETSLPFVCSSIRKKQMLLGNSRCQHDYHADSQATREFEESGNFFHIPCGLMWGRTYDIFRNDLEGIDAGLGHNPGPYMPGAIWEYYKLEPNMSKYDEESLSIDERLKYAVLRCYFTNKDEVDYDNIKNILI